VLLPQVLRMTYSRLRVKHRGLIPARDYWEAQMWLRADADFSVRWLLYSNSTRTRGTRSML
jgi:hypothetical protein